MQAVDLDRYGMVLFSTVKIPEQLRPEIVEGLGGEILDDVTLVVPPGVQDRTNGEAAPDAILSVSRTDPSHFEVIRNRDQVEPRGFEVVGKMYGVIESESSWEKFLETLGVLNAIARDAKGVEPPDSPDSPDLIEGP